MNRDELFEEYFQEYRELVMRMIIMKSGDSQLAQEISQQVFCALYHHMDDVEADCVKAWLFRSAQNALVDYLRKSGRRKEVTLNAVDSQERGTVLPETATDYYENRVINMELARRILREIQAVNEIWYEVLVMICVKGMSHREAASVLHVSEQVVRARLHRARGYVRQKYGDEYWGR